MTGVPASGSLETGWTPDTYKPGYPGTGKPFPDGSKMAKIHWSTKKLETFPSATVAGSLHDVDFMVKDSNRFADSGGAGICRIPV